MKTKTLERSGPWSRGVHAFRCSAISYGQYAAAFALLLLLSPMVHGGRAATCCPDNGGVKWLQPPDPINGVDVNATFLPLDSNVSFGPAQWVVADDFACTNTGYITDLHLWGSWLGDRVDSNATYTLTIWSDVPAGTSDPSHPGQMLWTETFTNGQYTMCFYTNWFENFYNGYDLSTSGFEEGSSTILFYLCFANFRTNFYQTGTQNAPTTYWLSVAVQSSAPNPSYFGWKSSATAYQDAAVYAMGNTLYPSTWYRITRQNIPVSLAFEITTTPPPPPICDESDRAVKYIQWPGLTNSFDVWNSTTNSTTRQWDNNAGPWVLADDFICTNSGPITDIHLWASWLNDLAATNSITFWLGMFSDVRPSPSTNYSHPGNLLYSQYFTPGHYAEGLLPNSAPAFFLDPTATSSGHIVGGDTNIWYYCFYPSNWCQSGTISNAITYWLAVYAQLTNTTSKVFGWKTTTNVQNDISVHAPWPGFSATPANWVPTALPGTPSPLYLDLAFKVNTSTNRSALQVTCATNQSKAVECGSNWSFDPPSVGTDSCCPTNPTVSFTASTNVAGCQQYITGRWTITDCLGSTAVCTQLVTVVDTIPPTITCWSNRTVECGSAWNFDQPTALDACCASNVTIRIVNTSTNIISACTQAITRTWIAVDCCSNTSPQCSQTITVVDTTPPSIVCPTNIIVFTCRTNAVVTWSISATDTCSSVTVTSTPPSGTAFALDTTNLVIATACDACGNSNSCPFTVAVVRAVSPIFIATLATNKVVLTWADGILQVATNVLGPYTDLLSATPPYTNTTFPFPPTNRFYRLRCPACLPTPAGVTNWWRAENDTSDATGNLPPGTLQNGATFSQGIVGRSLSFDGVDDLLLLGGASIQVPWTAEMWVNRQDAPAFSSVLMVDSVSALKLEQFNFTRQVGFTRFGVADYTFNYSAPVGTWTHLAFVGTGGGTTLYVNGAVQDFINVNIPLPLAQFGSDGHGDRLKGLVDEVTVYNRALTGTEIQAIYNAGAGGKCQCIVAPSGLLSWWRAEGDTSDVLGNNNGSLNGATFAVGKVGQAFSFDGANGAVIVPNNASLNFGASDSFTFELWVRIDGLSAANEDAVLHKYVPNVGGFTLEVVGPPAQRHFECVLGTGVFGLNLITVPVLDGAFHHLAVTLNRGTTTASIYLDGVLQTSSSSSGVGSLANASRLWIGHQTLDASTSAHPFHGLIDELSVYNRALSATEIQSIYSAGTLGKCVTP